MLYFSKKRDIIILLSSEFDRKSHSKGYVPMKKESDKIKKFSEFNEEDRKRKSRAIKIISLILAALVILSIAGYIVIQSIISGGNGFEGLTELAGKHPYIAALVLIVINIIQVIIAFIPGEIVEQACGLALGPYMGTVICLFSTMVGSCLVLLLVRKYGRNLVYAIYSKEKIDSISFLHDPKKRNMLTFTLFFIPGTPKDALTYAIGLTDMSIPQYIALTTVARLPSIIMSTVSGNWINQMLSGHGKLFEIVILNAASLVLCGVGYLIYMLISKKHTQKREEKSEKSENGDIGEK